MSLRNRVSKLERVCQTRLNDGENARSAAHDRVTGDHLLRLWENSEDWVRQRTEMVIEKCQGLSPEATTCLQERLRILQTGSPEEIFLVIAGLSRDAPRWSSLREGEVLAAALKVNPSMAKAVAEFGILRAGRTDWKAFAWWLERRVPQEYGRDSGPVEDPSRPKVVGAKFSLWAPEENSAKEEHAAPLIGPTSTGAGSIEDAPLRLSDFDTAGTHPLRGKSPGPFLLAYPSCSSGQIFDKGRKEL